MRQRRYLMLQDDPVLKIEDYTCIILDRDRLPVALRYDDVDYDDVFHFWTQTRGLNIGRTNAKQLLNALHLSQRNMDAVAMLCHYASITDSYWMKREEEDLSWQDVSLFHSEYSQILSAIALTGSPPGHLTDHPKLIAGRTADTALWGMSAKTVIREPDGLYLYKVGRREAGASDILDALNFVHVPYQEVSRDEAMAIAENDLAEQIYDDGECFVKCKLISSDQKSLVPWEDYLVYCDRNHMEPFVKSKECLSLPVLCADRTLYDQMQAADYVLNNADRHGANWGFFMENETGMLTGLHPLLDHDHAFSKERNLYSQTTEEPMLLSDAAKCVANQFACDLENVLGMSCPGHLLQEEWDAVQKRIRQLL